MTERVRSKLYARGGLVDMQGVEFKVGDRVAKSYIVSRSGSIEIRTVSKIEDGKLYLDTHQPVIYPNRLLIVTPLFCD